MTDHDAPIATRRIPRGVLPIVGILAMVALLVYVFNSRFGQDPRLVDSPLVGQPVSDLTFDYLEQDGTFSFADQRGTVLVVNFFASWCIPCRTEHRDLTTTSAAIADRGVHFLGIVYQDKPAQALLLAWIFGSFLQGATGFGVPAAVVAPLIVEYLP